MAVRVRIHDYRVEGRSANPSTIASGGKPLTSELVALHACFYCHVIIKQSTNSTCIKRGGKACII